MLACSPKVQLEFEDASVTLGWDDGTETTLPHDGSGGRGDDDDDDDRGDDSREDHGTGGVGGVSTDGGRIESETSVSDPTAPASTSVTPTTSDSVTTSDSFTAGVSDTLDTMDPDLQCYEPRDCSIGYRCVNHECIPIDDSGDDTGYDCPSGFFSHLGYCCEYGVGDDGACIHEPCALDDDCGGLQVCGRAGRCEAIQPAQPCDAPTSLVRDVVPAFIPATERIAAGDLDGDGTRDGLIAHQNTQATLWTVTGLTQSTLPSTSSTADFDYYVADLALGDFDEDGLDDLVIAFDYINATHVRSSRDPSTTYVIPTPLRDIKVGDIDLDGHLDVVGTDDLVHVLFGAGDGSFEQFSYASLAAQSLGVGDIDGDAAVDIIVASNRELNVVGFDPDRNLVWKLGLVHQSEPEDVFITDLEGDGIMDIGMLAGTSFGSVLYTWSSNALDDEPAAAYFERIFLHFAVPAPPDDHSLVLAGASGQLHVPSMSPVCWSGIDSTPVWDITTGFDPRGSGERLLLTTGSTGPRVTGPGL